VASSIAATATDALWGSTPIRTFMGARTSVSVGPLCHHRRARRTFRLRASAPIPLLSHSACHVLYGGTQAENNPTRLTSGRKFRSDPCMTGDLEA
jgi:hypothetical protein